VGLDRNSPALPGDAVSFEWFQRYGFTRTLPSNWMDTIPNAP